MKEIYKIRTGSHLYGLNTSESDEDYGGIFIPTIRQLLGTHPIKEVDLSTNKTNNKNTKEDIDCKYYTLPQFLHLVTANNPNIIEHLFPSEGNILIDSDIMQELRENYSKIVSKKVWYSFSGYAFAQKNKLETKRERFLNLQKGIKWLESNHDLYLDDKTQTINKGQALVLNTLMKYYKGGKHNCNSFEAGQHTKVIYEKLTQEYDNYGYRLKSESFKQLHYDKKFGYHLLRLLHEGRMLLETGKLTFPLTGREQEEMMSIRRGEVSYEDLLTLYDKYYILCEDAYKNTTLRDKPDFKWIEAFQIRVLLESIQEETVEKSNRNNKEITR